MAYTTNDVEKESIRTLCSFKYAVKFEVYLTGRETNYPERWRSWLLENMPRFLQFLDEDPARPNPVICEVHPRKPEVIRVRLKRRWGHFIPEVAYEFAVVRLNRMGLRLRDPYWTKVFAYNTPMAFHLKPEHRNSLPPCGPYEGPLADLPPRRQP
ncbi:MAG: hypothetical protein Q9159_003066 [Coniocarpon cinnabarinum]